MSALTEQQFDEVYNDVYKALVKALSGKNKSEDELKEIMIEIKKILTTEEEPVLSN